MKGKTEIILTDAKTGEVERYEEENMITNALSAVYNGMPYGLNSRGAFGNTGGVYDAESGISAEGKTDINTLFETIGGIYCFPQTIEENGNHLYEALSNYPTAYASNANDPYNEDLRRGSFSTESHTVDGGFQFVWDFATNQGNGDVSCICLTHARGGRAYIRNYDAFLDGMPRTTGTSGNGRGIGRYFTRTDNATMGFVVRYVLAYDDNNIVFLCGDNQVRRVKWKINNIGFDGYADVRKLGEAEILPVSVGTNKWISAGNKFYQMTNITATSIAWVRYDINGAQTGTGTWSFSGTNFRTASMDAKRVAMFGSYLYFPDASHTGFYRCDTANAADVKFVECEGGIAPDNTGVYCSDIEGRIWHTRGIIEGWVNFDSSTNLVFLPFRRKGVWLVSFGSTSTSNTQGYSNLATTLDCTYLASINNLRSKVTKTSAKSMKIIYTVTEA